jgi:hypothetical protein
MTSVSREENLTFLAGPTALSEIRDGGLSPGRVTTILGAAGGPKWLVLAGLDRAVFFDWLTKPAGPVALAGASIGAWRFAAVAQGTGARAAHDLFRHEYTYQHYDKKPSAQEITDEAVRIRDAYLSDKSVAAILSNPDFHLSILSVRGRKPFFVGTRSSVAAGMLLAGTANALSRANLGRFFVRVVFSDPRDGNPGDVAAAFGDDTIPTERVDLSSGNLKAAVLASGSIPMVMTPTVDIPGAPEGYYWDGGLVDYHVTLPKPPHPGRDGLILFPHYTDRIIPGWLDKHLPWRKPNPTNLDRTLMVAPSREFVARLPHGRIPDRTDFKRFWGDDTARIAFWEKTAGESERLGDEFLELVISGRIGDRVKPFPNPGAVRP